MGKCGCFFSARQLSFQTASRIVWICGRGNFWQDSQDAIKRVNTGMPFFCIKSYSSCMEIKISKKLICNKYTKTSLIKKFRFLFNLQLHMLWNSITLNTNGKTCLAIKANGISRNCALAKLTYFSHVSGAFFTWILNVSHVLEQTWKRQPEKNTFYAQHEVYNIQQAFAMFSYVHFIVDHGLFKTDFFPTDLLSFDFMRSL